MPITDFYPAPESKFKSVNTENLKITFNHSFAKLSIYDNTPSKYGFTLRKLILTDTGISHQEMNYKYIISKLNKYYDSEVKELLQKFNDCLV